MMDKDELKKSWSNLKEIFSEKKFQWIIFGILFLSVLVMGTLIRIQPITNGNLIDSTTGDYIPLALDPYYFLRISETLIQNNGT